MIDRPPSPCKTICTLEASGGMCTGCGRTVREIAEWARASAARQREIVRYAMARLPGL